MMENLHLKILMVIKVNLLILIHFLKYKVNFHQSKYDKDCGPSHGRDHGQGRNYSYGCYPK